MVGRTATAGRSRPVPERSCVGCRTPRSKRELIRIVRAPDGRVSIDPTGKAAGRGAYLCADGTCWRTALDKGAIARALRTPLPPELTAELEAGASTRTLSYEGGARGQE